MGIRFGALSKAEQLAVANYVRGQYESIVARETESYVANNAKADPARWQDGLRELIAMDPKRVRSVMETVARECPVPERGFTLIELSIVLVIIGLVVGGVLVGRELISAAAVRVQITQVEKFNTAVNTFRDKYGGIPGDLSVSLANQFGFDVPTSCTGQQGGRDGNGLIDGYIGAQTLSALMGENILFWSDLSKAHIGPISQLIGNNVTLDENCASSVTTADVSAYLPAGKIGYNTSIHVYETGGNNWFMLANIAPFSGTTSVVNASPSIPVFQAYNIDKKIDDGVATGGAVQAVYISGSSVSTSPAPNAGSDSSTTCYNSLTSAYSISQSGGSGPNCALSFRFQ